MAEPQYLFAEIPLSRSAFDRWLKSPPTAASHWPEWADLDMQEEKENISVLDALLPFFIEEQELQQCLLLHDKQQGVLRCALWLRYDEMHLTMIRMLALLRSTAAFMVAKVQGKVLHGENCCGTLTLTRDKTYWVPDCEAFSFPGWSDEWLHCLGEGSGGQWVDAKLLHALKRRYNHYLINASPEKPVQIKKTEYYSNGHEVIDYYGNVIKDANPLTFKRLCHTYFDTLYTDGQGIWIDSGLLELHRHKIAVNLIPEQIQVLEEGYDAAFLLRIDDKVWFRAQDETPGPFYLRALPIEPTSFRKLTSGEYADENAVYRFTENRGLHVVEDLHPDEVVRTVGEFLITIKGVYYFGKVLDHADGKSFRSLEHDFYCDDLHVWCRNCLLEGLNPQTFNLIAPEYGLVTDGQHVFIKGQRVPDADPQTLEVLRQGLLFYWRDKDNIWYQHSKLEGADLSRGDIEIYPGSVFCRIGDRIWGMSTELKDVDIESFVVTQWDYAEDKHGQFYRNRRLDDTNYA
ncbi:MAG: DKNYY domain-containing protein [Chania sp.]